MARRAQATLGAILVTVGLVGIVFFMPWEAIAAQGGASAHTQRTGGMMSVQATERMTGMMDRCDRLMDGMSRMMKHSSGTAQRGGSMGAGP